MREQKLLRRIATLALLGIASFASIATSPWWSSEVCDNGLDDDGDWLVDEEDTDCLFADLEICGDGYVSNNEVCDDDNTSNGDGCRRDCRGREVCGDGLVDPSKGESCDDGDVSSDACSLDCTTITATSFTSVDLNGHNPNEAINAVFGEGAIALASGGPDARVLLIIASSDPNICNTIQAATYIDVNERSLGGLEAFLANLSAGNITETTALIFAENLSSAAPFSAPGALEGDGESVGVDGGFAVGDGTDLLVDTTFGSDFRGSLVLQSLTPTAISGQYDGVQSFELVSGTLVSASLRGVFSGVYCQALTDGLQASFGK